MKRPDFDDAALQTSISSTKGWSALLAKWQKAYTNYVVAKGNAHKLKKLKTTPKIGKALYALYDAKGQTKAFLDMREALDGPCPMCGSDSTCDLDHLVPRKHYPEFSVFSANLVPTCNYCNRGVKKQTIKGLRSTEYFLHPYFDGLLKQRLWRATFTKPYEAVRIGWEPLPALSVDQQRQVAFHLNSVLGKAFGKTARGEWRKLIKALAVESEDFNGRYIPRKDVVDFIEKRLKFAETDGQQNCWEAALLRGMLADGPVIDWITKEARTKNLTPFETS